MEQPTEENYGIALQFCIDNVTMHTYQPPNPIDVEKLCDEFSNKFVVHAQRARAAAWNKHRSRFMKLPWECDTYDIHTVMLKVLLELANDSDSTADYALECDLAPNPSLEESPGWIPRMFAEVAADEVLHAYLEECGTDASDDEEDDNDEVNAMEASVGAPVDAIGAIVIENEEDKNDGVDDDDNDDSKKQQDDTDGRYDGSYLAMLRKQPQKWSFLNLRPTAEVVEQLQHHCSMRDLAHQRYLIKHDPITTEPHLVLTCLRVLQGTPEPSLQAPLRCVHLPTETIAQFMRGISEMVDLCESALCPWSPDSSHPDRQMPPLRGHCQLAYVRAITQIVDDFKWACLQAELALRRLLTGKHLSAVTGEAEAGKGEAAETGVIGSLLSLERNLLSRWRPPLSPWSVLSRQLATMAADDYARWNQTCLNALHHMVGESFLGDREQLSLALPVFIATMRPQLQWLEAFLLQGILEDSRGEFGIVPQAGGGVSEVEGWWESYQLRESALIDCLPLPLYQQMVDGGKAVCILNIYASQNSSTASGAANEDTRKNALSLYGRFCRGLQRHFSGSGGRVGGVESGEQLPLTREVTPQSGPLSQPLHQHPIHQEGGALPLAECLQAPLPPLQAMPWPVILRHVLWEPIEERCQVMQERLMNVLMGSERLLARLESVASVYLFARGHGMHTFCERLFSLVPHHHHPNPSPGAGRGGANAGMLSLALTESLRSALGDSAPLESDDTQFDCWRVEFPPNVESVTWRECPLIVHYKVPWPLNLILSPAVLHQYNRLLNFIVPLKRAKACLDECPLLPSIPHPAVLFRFKLMHFTNALQNYVMTRVIHSLWIELESKLEGVQSVSELLELHGSYLQKMTDRCLLSKRGTQVLETIKRALSVAVQFRGLLDSVAEGTWTSKEDDKMEVLSSEFDNCMRFLTTVLSMSVSRGGGEYLSDILVRLNYNFFYLKA
jgi:hypothetical protein